MKTLRTLAALLLITGLSLISTPAQAAPTLSMLGAEVSARLEEELSDANVTIVLASIDEKLNDKSYIMPGLGDAGDDTFALVSVGQAVDVITGGTGRNVYRLGSRTLFQLQNTEEGSFDAPDRITDFKVGVLGDVVDLSALQHWGWGLGTWPLGLVQDGAIGKVAFGACLVWLGARLVPDTLCGTTRPTCLHDGRHRVGRPRVHDTMPVRDRDQPFVNVHPGGRPGTACPIAP